MEISVSLTESQVIALESFHSEGINDIVQGIINQASSSYINTIAFAYIDNKLSKNQKIGFSNKNDIVISAKNEGFIEAQNYTLNKII